MRAASYAAVLVALTGSGLARQALAENDASHAALPVVKIAYFGNLERYCSRVSPAKPDPAAIAELERRLPEFQSAWDAGGPPLMRATVEVTRVPYNFRETVATLHACPDQSSTSYPFIIAAARYTQAAGGGAESVGVSRALAKGEGIPKLRPEPMSHFVQTVWHEMTHCYIHEAIEALPGKTTPLLRKYEKESGLTKTHIHLYAIQQLVYRRLDLEREYQALAESMKPKGYTNYIRAFAIVEAEGAEALVRELRPR